MKSTIIVFTLSLLFSVQAISGEKLVYSFKKFLVGSGELIYEIEKNPNQSESFYKLKSTTKIYVLRKLSKRLDHVSINREDLTPIKNTYCQYPRPRNGDHSCIAMNFENDGTYRFREYEAKEPLIQELSINSEDVNTMNMADSFNEFEVYKDQTHDIASFFLYPRYFNLSLNDTGKKFYISILKNKGQIVLEVQKLSDTQLKLIFKAGAGSDSKVSDYVPKHAIFDIEKKVVTSLLLRTKFGDVTLNLNKSRSVLNK